MNISFDSGGMWSFAIGLLIIVELLSGTFFLLILAFGALAGFLCAIFDLSLAAQMFGAILVVLIGLFFIWHYKYKRTKALVMLIKKEGIENDFMGFDLGKPLFVEKWDATGHARARYRGSEWFVRYLENKRGRVPAKGWFLIRGIDGITLLVSELDC